MAERYPANVEIVYVDGDRRIRHTLRSALQHSGYESTRAFATLNDAVIEMDARATDILLVDGEQLKARHADFVARLRAQEVGRNPFLSVIVLSDNLDAKSATRFINGGADYIVVKPVAPSQLVERFKSIARNRKPFEITVSYIGPDRGDFLRAEEREAGTLVEVLNTVALKARNQNITAGELALQVSNSMRDVNLERLRHDARHVSYLAVTVADLIADGKAGRETAREIDHVFATIEDIRNRLPPTVSQYTIELCGLLLEVTEGLKFDVVSADSRIFPLMTALADAIFVSLSGADDAEGFAQRVLQMARSAKALLSASGKDGDASDS